MIKIYAKIFLLFVHGFNFSSRREKVLLWFKPQNGASCTLYRTFQKAEKKNSEEKNSSCKVATFQVDEIRDGTIARELEFLNHGIRTKLDEIKRQELERLR